MSIYFRAISYIISLKILMLLSVILLLISCSNSPKNSKSTLKKNRLNRSTPYYYSEEYQKKKEQDLIEFKDKLTLLYYLSEKEKDSAIWKAKELIKNYTLILDTTKSIECKDRIDYYPDFIGNLHYFIGETYYKNNELDKSLKEFEFETGQFNEISKACIYVKQKQFEKAYSELDSLIFRHYLCDFLFANYFETIGEKQKASQKYKSLISESWINNGNYNNLNKRVKERIVELNKSNAILLHELYFPTINPQKTKDNL
jgi:hypothetical protein